jgi:hypothetical protein
MLLALQKHASGFDANEPLTKWRGLAIRRAAFVMSTKCDVSTMLLQSQKHGTQAPLTEKDG